MLGRILAQPLVLGCLVAAAVGAAALVVPPAGEPTVIPHLHVAAPAAGTITSTPAGIACGRDCDEAFGGAERVTLVAAGGPPGYFPDWRACAADAAGRCVREPVGCDSEANGQCSHRVLGNVRISLSWEDGADPAVALVSPPPRVGPATTFRAKTRDNSGPVRAVRFYVDGELVKTDVARPFTTSVPVESYAQGSAHRLTARAFDAAGRASVTPPHRFQVDARARAAFLAPTPRDGAHVNHLPLFAFRTDGDIPAGGVVCRARRARGATLSILPCSSPFVPQASADGPYDFQLEVSDHLGNTSVYTRRFRLDRRAPGLRIAWPRPYARLRAGFVPGYRAVDETTRMSRLAVTCKLDRGSYRPCGPVRGSRGAHTLFVRATDRAGNYRFRWVRFRLAGPRARRHAR